MRGYLSIEPGYKPTCKVLPQVSQDLQISKSRFLFSVFVFSQKWPEFTCFLSRLRIVSSMGRPSFPQRPR